MNNVATSTGIYGVLSVINPVFCHHYLCLRQQRWNTIQQKNVKGLSTIEGVIDHNFNTSITQN